MYRILYVEDESDFQHTIVELLSSAGFEMTIASNGQEALEILMENPTFDLVLSDLMMPKIDGYKMLKTIRTHRTDYRDVPFVFLSAVHEKAMVIRAHQLGCDDYLSKAIDLELLLSIIHTRLKRRYHNPFVPSPLQAG